MSTPKQSPLLDLIIKYKDGLLSRDFIIDYFVDSEFQTKEEAIKSRAIKPGKLYIDRLSLKGIIDFPKEEHVSLLKRLHDNKDIVTTRVSAELGKYHVGDKLSTTLSPNIFLIVTDVKRFSNIADHPFHTILTKSQKDLISSYGDFDVIRLKQSTSGSELVYVVTEAESPTKIKDAHYVLVDKNHKLSFYHRFTLKKGMIENYDGPDVETTLGVFLLNQNCLVAPFYSAIPYVNGYWDIGKIEADIAKAVIAGKITTQQVMSYTNNTYNLSSLNDFCVPALSEKAITANPEVNKLRAELFAKYKDQLNDPNIMIKIEETLIALDKKLLKGDMSNGFMIQGKNYNVHRKRMFLMMGLVESFGDEVTSYRFSKTNLNDGWDLNELDVLANDIRRGSYDRAKSTALGGVETKMLGRNFQDSAIISDDCETKRGLHIHLTKDNSRSFIYRNIIEGDKLITLTEENIHNYIGKDIVVRSPMYCNTQNGYCYTCMDTRFKAVGVKLLNIHPIGISSELVNLALKSMHGKKIDLININNLNDHLI